MNGVHDMGGMHGMGPISHEMNEPVFHSRWEGRVYAMDRDWSFYIFSGGGSAKEGLICYFEAERSD